jgi:hypothetical protein
MDNHEAVREATKVALAGVDAGRVIGHEGIGGQP